VDLYLQDSTIGVILTFNNKIPIKFRYKISGLRPNGSYLVTGRNLLNDLYPSNTQFFLVENTLDKYIRPESGKENVNLRFEYFSRYYELSNDPKLHGIISKSYLLDWNNKTFSHVKESP
jgi:hypothetical protein